MSDKQFTKRGQRTLELAYREALSMGMSHIDTPHILRALQRQIDEIDWQQVGVEVGAVMSKATYDALAAMDGNSGP